MKVLKGQQDELRRTLYAKLGEAVQKLEVNATAEARTLAGAVLEAEGLVQFEPTEWALSFSSIEEFIYACSLVNRSLLHLPKGTTRLIWNPVPVHEARLVLAQAAIAEKQAAEAEHQLRLSLDANPISPETHLELAYVLQSLLERPAESLTHARNAFRYARTPNVRARALRAAGAACIDLKTLDLARCFYLESDNLEDTDLAESQLRYIRAESITARDVLVPAPEDRAAALRLLGFSPAIEPVAQLEDAGSLS